MINNISEPIVVENDQIVGNCSYKYSIEKFSNQEELANQKLFTNMVVHDLRNPAEAIKGGL